MLKLEKYVEEMNDKCILYRVILNDCSRSRPCPCYHIFAAFM
jgi:hypothetical protein